MARQEMISLNPIKAIMFDLDGTLVRSRLNFKQIRNDINCPHDQDVLSYVESLSVEEKRRAENIIRQHELEDAYAAEEIAGAIALLHRLEGMGIKTAIVTRNSFEATQIKIDTCGVKVQEALTREDAPAKPNPDALLYFCEKWRLLPQECVYVGDYLYDLQAANNAKMHACLFVEKEQLGTLPSYAALADFICDDYEHFELDLSRYLVEKK